MEYMMTKDEIRQIVFEYFSKNYNVDLYTLESDFPLNRLQELNEKIDSMEVINMLFELEEIFKIDSITIDDIATTVEGLIDYIYDNMVHE
jgi:acyl carrier protein